MKILIPTCLTILVVFGCKDQAMLMDDPVVSDPEIPVTPEGDEQYLTLDSDYLFDQSKLPTFELNLSSTALAKLDTDPAAEEYVEGSLTFEGETISPVGIRYKGSVGAFVNCLSGGNWADPSGYKTCTKLSMKIKINWEGREDKFYGLKKIQLHSQNQDPSQMRERLGYWFFRQMGVPAPRSVHARVLINGQYSGLYALTEQIDGRFTKYNFDDGDGNLYKEVWPIDSDGQAQSAQTYLNQLKTNEDDNPSITLMQSFAQEIASASSTNLPNVIANRMDLDQIMAYVAVDRTIRNDDGAFHWYCNANQCSNHNYYWYEEPSKGRLHLIPWDLDNAFENIISNANPVTPIADDWGETSANCAPFSYGAWGIRQRSAACDKLTEGWVSFTTAYEEKRTAFKQGPLTATLVNAHLDQWSAQIRNATSEAKELHDDAISVSQWENALDQLKAQLEFARTH